MHDIYIYICPHVCYDVLCVWSNLVDIPPPWRFMDSHEMSGTTKCWLPLSIVTNHEKLPSIIIGYIVAHVVKPCQTMLNLISSVWFLNTTDWATSLGSLSRLPSSRSSPHRSSDRSWWLFHVPRPDSASVRNWRRCLLRGRLPHL